MEAAWRLRGGRRGGGVDAALLLSAAAWRLVKAALLLSVLISNTQLLANHGMMTMMKAKMKKNLTK